MGPKARLWVSSPTRASSCSSEQDSFSWPSQSTALLQPPGWDTAREVKEGGEVTMTEYCQQQSDSSVKHQGSKRSNWNVFLSAHLNSTALKKIISVVLAPHTMCPMATSVLESSWLGLCLVEFNTVVNSAASWDEKQELWSRCALWTYTQFIRSTLLKPNAV